MQMVDTIVAKIIGWIDQLFAFFGAYSSKYSKLFMYALLLFVAGKVFKVKINLPGGK